MSSGDTLRRLLDEAGYEVVDPEAEQTLFRFVSKSQLGLYEIQKIISAWVAAGEIRPSIPKPKGDEPFRLFTDKFYEAS